MIGTLGAKAPFWNGMAKRHSRCAQSELISQHYLDHKLSSRILPFSTVTAAGECCDK
jgi:hypothetical protein